jgi:hypothetical protein
MAVMVGLLDMHLVAVDDVLASTGHLLQGLLQIIPWSQLKNSTLRIRTLKKLG